MKCDKLLLAKQISLTCSDFKFKTDNFNNLISSHHFTKNDVEIFIIELLNFYLVFSCFQEMKHITNADFTEILSGINLRVIELKKYV